MDRTQNCNHLMCNATDEPKCVYNPNIVGPTANDITLQIQGYLCGTLTKIKCPGNSVAKERMKQFEVELCRFLNKWLEV